MYSDFGLKTCYDSFIHIVLLRPFRELKTIIFIFKLKKMHISFIFKNVKFQGFRRELYMPLYKWRVIRNYAYSPFTNLAKKNDSKQKYFFNGIFFVHLCLISEYQSFVFNFQIRRKQKYFFCTP